MKLALLLFGISLEINKHWQYGTSYSVDYNNSYENYQKYIYEYFKNKGYDIDVYISTNILPENYKEDLFNKYKPVKCNFIETIEDDRHLSKNIKIDDVVNLCINEGREYDLILITRFDLLFKKDFANSNIQFDKFNIVSILENPDYICDNFYLFPYKYLSNFSNIIKKDIRKSHHFIKEELENIGCPINYILNEHTEVANLSFYKIVRTPYI
jgi:hypothetical protein